MNQIYQYATNFLDKDLFVFVNAENESIAFSKVFDQLAIGASELKHVKTFVPVTFNKIIEDANLKVDKTYFEQFGNLRTYENNVNIKIVCCGLCAHVNDFDQIKFVVNNELFDTFFNTGNNKFLD